MMAWVMPKRVFKKLSRELKIFVAPAGFLAPEGQKPEEAP